MITNRSKAALIAALPAALIAPAIAGARTFHNGDFTGRTYSAYYGYVQVRAIVRHGRLEHVQILRHPSDRMTSRFIASRSLPVLEREAIRSQDARVDLVSGATLTSRAFVESLRSALDKAY